MQARLQQQLLRQRTRVRQHHEHLRKLDRTADTADRVQLQRRGFEMWHQPNWLRLRERIDAFVERIRCARMHERFGRHRRDHALLLHAELRGATASAVRSALCNVDLQRHRHAG